MCRNVKIKNFQYDHQYTLSVERNTSLPRSATHRNPKHQHETRLDAGYVNLSLLNKHITKKPTSSKEETNAIKSQEVTPQKSQKLLAPRSESPKQTKAGTASTQPVTETERTATAPNRLPPLLRTSKTLRDPTVLPPLRHEKNHMFICVQIVVFSFVLLLILIAWN